MHITVIGSGYVGLVAGACLANVGHNVICADVDEAKVKCLKTGEFFLRAGSFGNRRSELEAGALISRQM